MPYAIHLRKSRADLEAEARGEGESLARHRARLLAFAERAGLPIVAEYSEIISGDRLSDRPEMQRLLADVAAGSIGCWMARRLTRSLPEDKKPPFVYEKRPWYLGFLPQLPKMQIAK